MTLVRWLAIAVISLSLVGCATTDIPRQAPAGMTATGRWAVLSIVNAEAELKYVGATVFGNEIVRWPIDSWGLDRRIEQAVVDGLRPTMGNRVGVLVLDDRAQARSHWEQFWGASKDFERRAKAGEQFMQLVLSAAKAQGVDNLILVRSWRVDWEGPPGAAAGFGYYARFPRDRFAYLIGGASAMRVADRSAIFSRPLLKGSAMDAFLDGTNFLRLPLPEEKWPDNVKALGEDHRELLRLAFEALADDSAKLVVGAVLGEGQQ